MFNTVCLIHRSVSLLPFICLQHLHSIFQVLNKNEKYLFIYFLINISLFSSIWLIDHSHSFVKKKRVSSSESMGIFNERWRDSGGEARLCLWVAWVSESISCRLCVTEGTLVAEGRGMGKRIDGGDRGWSRVAGGRCGCEPLGGRIRARGHD